MSHILINFIRLCINGHLWAVPYRMQMQSWLCIVQEFGNIMNQRSKVMKSGYPKYLYLIYPSPKPTVRCWPYWLWRPRCRPPPPFSLRALSPLLVAGDVGAACGGRAGGGLSGPFGLNVEKVGGRK